MMNENRVIGQQRYPTACVVATGAAVGAAVAFVMLTAEGRRFGDSVVDALDTFSTEWRRLLQATTRAKMAATEGWQALDFNSTGGRV